MLRRPPWKKRAERLEDLRKLGPSGFVGFSIFGAAMFVFGGAILWAAWSLVTTNIAPTSPPSPQASEPWAVYFVGLLLCGLGIMLILFGSLFLWLTLPVTWRVLIGRKSLQDLMKDVDTPEAAERPGTPPKRRVRLHSDREEKWKMHRLVIPVFRIGPLVLLVVGVAEELTSHHISIGFLVFWIAFFLVFMRVASARIKSMEDRWRLWKRSGIRVDHTPCVAGELVPFRFVLRAPVEIRGYSVELVARSHSFAPERQAKGRPDEEKDDEDANPINPTESVVEHIVQPIETKRLPVRPGGGLIAEGQIPIPERIPGTGLQDYEEWEWGIRVWVEAAPPGAEATGPEQITKPVAAFFPLEVTTAIVDSTPPNDA